MPLKKKTVTVVGLGCIGLPLAIVIATKKYRVYGIDINAERLMKIKKLDPSVVEFPMESLLQEALEQKTLTIHSEIVQPSDFFIICVPTHSGEQEVNFRFLKKAIESIIPFVTKGTTIVIESTIPVGRTNQIANDIANATKLTLDQDIFVAYCPERTMPGHILKELIGNKRVIGGISKISTEKAASLYCQFVESKIETTTAETAELVKIIENSYRNLEIGFANEIYELSKNIDLNPFEVIRLANLHPRINILRPGPGVGGTCIPRAPLLFEHGTTETIPEILKASMKVNNQKEESVFSEIIAKTKILKKKGILNPEIIIMGLAYKDNTKHLQGSVALRIARKLNKKDALKVKVFDPNIPAEDIEKFNLIRKNIQPGAFVNADIIAILVGHREFYQMTMDCHFLIDPCGVMPKQKKKSVLKKIVDFITTGASQSAKK